MISRFVAAVSIVALLAGCSGAQKTAAQNADPQAVGATVNKFASAVSGFNAGIQGVLDKINAGIKVAAQDFKMVCGAGGVAGGLFDAVAPLAGASAQDKSNEQLAMLALNAACASTPTDVGSATATVLGAYQTVAKAVNSAAPQAQVMQVTP